MGYTPLTWSLFSNVFLEHSYKVSSWSIPCHNEDLFWKSWTYRSLRHSYCFGSFPHNLEKDRKEQNYFSMLISRVYSLGERNNFLHYLQKLNCMHILLDIIYYIYYKLIIPIINVWNVIWTMHVLQRQFFLSKVHNRNSIVFRVPFQVVSWSRHRKFCRTNPEGPIDSWKLKESQSMS